MGIPDANKWEYSERFESQHRTTQLEFYFWSQPIAYRSRVAALSLLAAAVAGAVLGLSRSGPVATSFAYCSAGISFSVSCIIAVWGLIEGSRGRPTLDPSDTEVKYLRFGRKDAIAPLLLILGLFALVAGMGIQAALR